jgi:outer membrane protein assembly factor BamB
MKIRPHRIGSLLLSAALSSLYAVAAFAESGQWPRWRGPNDNGSAGAGAYPERWSEQENLLWKTELPGKGCSTPVVWERNLYLTAPVDGADALLALDWNGKTRWKTVFGPETAGKHRNGSGCNPSPATDGQAVYVLYKSGTLAAVDLAGKIRWQTNLIEKYGKPNLYWDYGISPVLTADNVIVANLHHGESWLAAFDKASGELKWKVDRTFQTPVEGDHSYATPVVVTHQGREIIVVLGGERLTAHDARDGSTVWTVSDFNPEAKNNWVAVGSPVPVGETLVVPYGRGARLHGIRLGGSGDVTASHRAWTREDTGSFVPTPAASAGRVFLGRDRGELECIDPVTGRTLWSGALPKDKSSYYSSPTVADGKLYFAREDGVVFVTRAGENFELLSENPMGERIIAAPVPVDGRLFIRGEKHLFCIGTK